MPNLFMRNLTGTWKRFMQINLFTSHATTAYLISGAPSENAIQQVKDGTLILLIKKDNGYSIAFRDKDGDYQEREMTDPSIITAFDHYKSTPILLENNQVYPNLLKDINNRLAVDNSASVISSGRSPIASTGIGVLVAAATLIVGVIATPFIAGIKTLFDWATRKPLSKDKMTPAVAIIKGMQDSDFDELTKQVTKKYHQGLNTSNSSRIMIKQFNGQNTSQSRDQDKADLIRYIEDPINNGKKLFRTVLDTTNFGAALTETKAAAYNPFR